ncbi:thioredoxin F2, chloroplastic-like [Aristolochia californica]|uniref:thioredoxin F2, chloroplastic-like n=1 Tax=Aristolochia californica TaxID=171875 RepID=UPI0035DBDCDD
MALQMSLTPPSLRSATSASWSSASSTSLALPDHLRRSGNRGGGVSTSAVRRGMKVRSSLETAGAVLGQVTEVNQDSFWPIVEAAGEKVVVLDMYTQWCGPCKVIAPKFQELSKKYSDVVFLKLDCNQDNKTLAKELGIRVVPTFKILKDGKVVKEVTGAKLDDLIFAIETVKSG